MSCTSARDASCPAASPATSGTRIPTPSTSGTPEAPKTWDVDGHEYVDCRLGFGPVILGHSPEVITASVMRALMNGTVYALPHAGETELAEEVVDSVPGVEMTTCCSSGSEATLHALRLARAYTGRKTRRPLCR